MSKLAKKTKSFIGLDEKRPKKKSVVPLMQDDETIADNARRRNRRRGQSTILSDGLGG
jgi:hypothetical protein